MESTCEVQPSQFYTGLVAELYEPLRSVHFTADGYAPFIDRAGQPALELGCGSGDPMLDLVDRGYDVDGLDSSEDMLALCRARAAMRGLSVRLYRQEMQAMSLPRRYRAIFLAGATFTLLTDDAQACAALTAIHEHLLEGGSALIPLAGPDLSQSLGVWREAHDNQGALLRVATVRSQLDRARRLASTCLRYERVHQDGREERVDRTIHTRWWRAADFAQMAADAGFYRTKLRTYDGGTAGDECTAFVAKLERGARV